MISNYFTVEELNSIPSEAIAQINSILYSVASSYSDEGVKEWLNRPRYLLNGKSPKEVILSYTPTELEKLSVLASSLES